MNTYFRSFRSSSAGNCLALWTGDTSILLDCGVRTLRECRTLLREHQDGHGPVDAVLVSHAHGDHLTGQALRVLEEAGIPIRAHRDVASQLRDRHDGERAYRSPIQPFPADAFTVGDFRITAVPLPHAPGVPTFGFVILSGHGAAHRKIVVCTDFHDFSPIVPHLEGADFVFVEANHDLDLLRAHPNPNSRYHLNNVKAAWLLCHGVRRGHFVPGTVVLGHLSEERNRERLALGEVDRVFARQGLGVDFSLEAAPKHEPSRVIAIGRGQPLD